ncbi:hypothetical protein EV189_3447 [Motilibacter rhizosphaerae]|uniref:Uncharacterized protein n=1 Tax=Motilibacter rhizosphaerae TaxID=598652 RepID=A0A4Q7NAL3_9ACTN|nr:hypothetical protein [Motilibacter rhizosphaerae]RZS79968.1 hypothetical protein EV189_3447 [Motilibacter rhizosphaerae]
MRVAYVAVLTAALVAGCAPAAGTGAGVVTSAAPAPAPSDTRLPAMTVSCSADPAADPGPATTTYAPLPGGVTVTGARLCRQLVVPRPGRGTWQQTVTYAVVGGLDALVRTYQRPDGPAGTGICSAVGYVPLLVTFTTARDGDIEAREPRGHCNEPVEEAVHAYASLRLQRIRSVWGRQVESQRAVDSGCAEQWKDMLVVERTRAAATLQPRPLQGRQRVCVYHDRAPNGSAGDPVLVAAAPAAREQVEAVVQHLHAGGPVCRSTGRTFVVLGEPQGDIVYVALDRCRGRALWDSGTGTLDRPGLRLLDGLLARAR